MPRNHMDLPFLLKNLGYSYAARFRRTGNLVDINEAISNEQCAIDLTPHGHINLPVWLSNLVQSFLTRFGHTGELADIERAVSNRQRLVELTAYGHVNRAAQLSNLGYSLHKCFLRTQKLEDFKKAVSAYCLSATLRHCVSVLPKHGPSCLVQLLTPATWRHIELLSQSLGWNRPSTTATPILWMLQT